MYKNNAFLLLSGGLDSTCLLPYYLSKGFNIMGLWVDYNQLGNEYEERAVDYFCHYHRINLIKQKLEKEIVVKNRETMEYCGRNLLLISLALSMFPYKHGLICTGIRYTPIFYDCQEKFILDACNLVENLSKGLVLLDQPFFNYSKEDILLFARKHNVDINRTYSCNRGQPNGCKNCISCIEREKAIGGLKINGQD
jgi:7-cyano-7-deazaguanine synthase